MEGCGEDGAQDKHKMGRLNGRRKRLTLLKLDCHSLFLLTGKRNVMHCHVRVTSLGTAAWEVMGSNYSNEQWCSGRGHGFLLHLGLVSLVTDFFTQYVFLIYSTGARKV